MTMILAILKKYGWAQAEHRTPNNGRIFHLECNIPGRKVKTWYSLVLSPNFMSIAIFRNTPYKRIVFDSGAGLIFEGLCTSESEFVTIMGKYGVIFGQSDPADASFAGSSTMFHYPGAGHSIGLYTKLERPKTTQRFINIDKQCKVVPEQAPPNPMPNFLSKDALKKYWEDKPYMPVGWKTIDSLTPDQILKIANLALGAEHKSCFLMNTYGYIHVWNIGKQDDGTIVCILPSLDVIVFGPDVPVTNYRPTLNQHLIQMEFHKWRIKPSA